MSWINISLSLMFYLWTDDVNVKADAHKEDGMWSASIYDDSDIYILEVSLFLSAFLFRLIIIFFS